MNREEMIKEIEEHVGKANMKIIEMGKAECISLSDDGVKISVMLSGSEKYSGDVRNITGLKAAKHAVWACVDEVRGFKLEKKAPTAFERLERATTFAGVMQDAERIVDDANATLEDIVKGGFPYTIDEVRMSVSSDSAGIYVHSGNTPVISVARAGDPEGVVREIRSAVLETVDITRSAVERRGKMKEEADDLASCGVEVEKAMAALRAAGISTDLLKVSAIPAEIAEEVFEAAEAAVREANRGMSLNFGSAVSALGGREAVKLRVNRHPGGFVVEADGKPCLVSRFPKTLNGEAVKRTVEFVKVSIAALGESRRRYLAEVRDAIEREERLHEIAVRLDAADMALAAAM